MAQIDDLKVYLGMAAMPDTYTDAQLNDALAAETASQSHFLKAGIVVTVHPDLVQALFRRVARNLAMRALPLAISDGEAGATRIGGRDPEIRRLEGPYRRRVVG